MLDNANETQIFSVEEQEKLDVIEADRERVAELEKEMKASSLKHRFIDDNGKTWDGRTALASDEWADFVIINENGNKELSKRKVSCAGRINPAYVDQTRHSPKNVDVAAISSGISLYKAGYDGFEYWAHFHAKKAMGEDRSLSYTKAYQLAFIEIYDVSVWSAGMAITEKETAIVLLKYA